MEKEIKNINRKIIKKDNISLYQKQNKSLNNFLNNVFYCDFLKILKKLTIKSIDLIIVDQPYYKKMLKNWKKENRLENNHTIDNIF